MYRRIISLVHRRHRHCDTWMAGTKQPRAASAATVVVGGLRIEHIYIKRVQSRSVLLAVLARHEVRKLIVKLYRYPVI